MAQASSTTTTVAVANGFPSLRRLRADARSRFADFADIVK
jgi:hypothetical protein